MSDKIDLLSEISILKSLSVRFLRIIEILKASEKELEDISIQLNNLADLLIRETGNEDKLKNRN